MDDERPPSPGWSMLRRILLAGLLIAALSGGATATVALNTVGGIASKVFQNSFTALPKGVVTPAYSGEPETFLILGSDRRVGSKDAEDREDPPHSDTILLVRFDPEQDQTSVLSIPRDLEVNIKLPNGQVAVDEKVNAAYTIGNRLGGAKGGIVLAAETIEREVFPGLKLNGIVDISFAGFIKVVDTLGCAYVNVDHRYYNANVGTPETDYTSINLQPGYQKLCYENALDYVRYRHTDSDIVRVARQQDFIRDLREQISPGNVVGEIDQVASAVGRAISSTIKGSASELIELAKLITFSQGKPLRQVKFRFLSENAVGPGGGSYVTSTPELERATLDDFLHGHEQLAVPAPAPASHHSKHSHHGSSSSAKSLRALNLYPTSSTDEGEAVKASFNVPFPVLYPTVQTGQAEQQQVRAYTLDDQQKEVHHAYVEVWQQNIIGGYYDLEGTDWLNPPLFAHAHREKIDGRSFLLVDDGSHIHVIGWRSGHALYWLTNTLLEELSNAQMVAIAKSATGLH